MTDDFHDRIVSLLSPAFLTKRPVDVDAIVHQLERDWPTTPTAKLRLAVASVAKDMQLRLRNPGS